MTVIPTITLADAEADLADAKTLLDAEERRSFTGLEPAYVAAEDAHIAAVLRYESVKSQQPQRGRAFSDGEVYL